MLGGKQRKTSSGAPAVLRPDVVHLSLKIAVAPSVLYELLTNVAANSVNLAHVLEGCFKPCHRTGNVFPAGHSRLEPLGVAELSERSQATGKFYW